MTDKVVRFPVIEGGGPNCDEAEVMILLGKAADANLVRVAIIGVSSSGETFRVTNGSEIEAVALHESAKLHYFFENDQ